MEDTGTGSGTGTPMPIPIGIGTGTPIPILGIPITPIPMGIGTACEGIIGAGDEGDAPELLAVMAVVGEGEVFDVFAGLFKVPTERGTPGGCPLAGGRVACRP